MEAGAGGRLVVGLVRGLYGLRGGVRVEILSDDAGRFRRGSRLLLEGSADPLTVTWSQQDGPGVLLRFREVTSRDAAEALRDRYLEAEVVPDALPEGAFWWHEVVGTRVRTTGGEELGTVEEVFRAGGGEVFVVRGGSRGEVLVPGVTSVVVDFAPREGRLLVDADALGLDDSEPRSRIRGRRTTRARRARELADRAAAPVASPEAQGDLPTPAGDPGDATR